MSLIFIPFYIKFMGIEAYGLIGIYVSLLTLLSILDMGLSSTLSRELARLSIAKENDQESKNLVRTLEYIYWSIGILIAAGLIISAPLLAHYWIKSQNVPAQIVQQAIMIMGLVVAFQWPASLYDGGLMGLQRQVLMNSVRGIMATVQHAGAVLVLWLLSPSILAYFVWQILISVVQTLLLARCVWASLPATPKNSSFRAALLKKNWKFAAGMTSISFMAVILTQTDKILLSKLLTLTTFGYYMLAFNVANAVGQLVTPIFLALFPKLSQMIASKTGDDANIAALYHRGSQLVSIIILPAAVVLALFSEQVLELWVHDPIIGQNTHLLLSLLVIGSALNAVMILPLTLQLAYGWTRLSFFKNVLAVIIFIPSLLLLVNHYGAIGAAIAWILLNAGYFCIEIPVMHRRLLRHDMWQWYVKDVAAPAFIVFCVTVISRVLMPYSGSSYFIFFWIFATGIFAVCLSSLSTPFANDWIKKVKT